MALVDAVSLNDRRGSLVALRDVLADAIDGCESLRDLAALSARLADVLQQIESIPDRAEVSAADEVSKRRANRRSSAKVSARASGS